MDYERIIDRLRSQHRMLTVTDVAKIFGMHMRSIERWIKEAEFPAPALIDPPSRLWRPDVLLIWAEKQQADALDMIGVEEVCTRVGLHPETWRDWVKHGKAPEATRREFGSGRFLWRVSVIDEWLKELTGGYPLPNARKYRRVTTHNKRGPKCSGSPKESAA